MVQRVDISIPSVISATIDVVSKVGSISYVTGGSIGYVRQLNANDFTNLPRGVDKNSVLQYMRTDTTGRTNITGSVDINTGSVNIKGQPIQVKQTSALNMYVLGNAVTPSMTANFIRCDANGNLYVVSGSIGLRGGSVGIKNGSIGVNSLPSITGTVEVSNQRGTVQLKTFSTATEGSVTINSVNSRLIRNPKTDRKYLALTNYSGTACFLSLSGSALVNTGIYMGANGGAFEITQNNLYVGSVTAQTSSGTAFISFSEG